MTLNGSANETLETMRKALRLEGKTIDQINRTYLKLMTEMVTIDKRVVVENTLTMKHTLTILILLVGINLFGQTNNLTSLVMNSLKLSEPNPTHLDETKALNEIFIGLLIKVFYKTAITENEPQKFSELNKVDLEFMNNCRAFADSLTISRSVMLKHQRLM